MNIGEEGAAIEIPEPAHPDSIPAEPLPEPASPQPAGEPVPA